MNEIKELITESKLGQGKHYAIAWMTDAVLLGLWSHDTGFTEAMRNLSADKLIGLRIFNPAEELHIFRREEKLTPRYKAASEGGYVYVQKPYMWGSRLREGNIVFEPNRGMALILPFSVSQDSLPLRYEAHHYYDYDDHGHIVFYDLRLHTILDKNGRDLEVLDAKL